MSYLYIILTFVVVIFRPNHVAIVDFCRCLLKQNPQPLYDPMRNSNLHVMKHSIFSINDILEFYIHIRGCAGAEERRADLSVHMAARLWISLALFGSIAAYNLYINITLKMN